MTILTKDSRTLIIPGVSGTPAVPGTPGIPAYCVTVKTQTPVYTQTPQAPQESSGSSAVFTSGGKSEGGFIMAAGYESQVTMTVYGAGSTYVPVVTSVSYVTTYSSECFPEVPAVIGSPGSPPTPSQVLTFLNQGWNSWARSVDPIQQGSYIKFTLKKSNSAAVYGLAHSGQEGQRIGQFAYSILVDQSGVYAYENGFRVHTFYSGPQDNLEFQIHRRTDRAIEYRVISPTDTKTYTSSELSIIPSSINTYAYAYLFSGGDTGLSAEILSSSVSQLVSINFSGSSELHTTPVQFKGSSVLTPVPIPGPETLSSQFSSLFSYATSQAPSFANLPALVSKGSDYEYAEALNTAPALTSYGGAYEYAPYRPTFAYGNLPTVASVATSTSIYSMTGEASLGPLSSIGADHKYAVGNQELPALFSQGIYELYTYGLAVLPSFSVAGVVKDDSLDFALPVPEFEMTVLFTDVLLSVDLPAFTLSMYGGGFLSAELPMPSLSLDIPVGKSLELEYELPQFSMVLNAGASVSIDMPAISCELVASVQNLASYDFTVPLFDFLMLGNTVGVSVLEIDLPMPTAAITVLAGIGSTLIMDMPQLVYQMTSHTDAQGSLSIQLPVPSVELTADRVVDTELTLNLPGYAFLSTAKVETDYGILRHIRNQVN